MACAFVVLLTVGCAGDRPAKPSALTAVGTREPPSTPEPNATITLAELEEKLLAFADRYVEATAEAIDEAIVIAGADRERSLYREVKAVMAESAVSIATSPNSVRGLYDFLVLLTLERWVWSETPPDWAPAAGAEKVSEALDDMEASLVDLARKVVPPDTIDSVQALARQWIADHPDRSYVAFVRLEDIGDADQRQKLLEEPFARGFLAPVDRAAKQLELARSLGERGLFLANHLLLLADYQGEAFIENLLSLPEVGALLTNSDRLTDAVANLEDLAPQLVDQAGEVVAREREAALRQVSALVALERQALLTELEAATEDTRKLVLATSAAARDAENTLSLLYELNQAWNESDVEFGDYQVLVADLLKLAERSETVLRLLTSVSAGVPSESALAAADRLIVRAQMRLFFLLAGLLILAGIVVSATALVLRRGRSTPVD